MTRREKDLEAAQAIASDWCTYKRDPLAVHLGMLILDNLKNKEFENLTPKQRLAKIKSIAKQGIDTSFINFQEGADEYRKEVLEDD